jgi:hypothetical protein
VAATVERAKAAVERVGLGRSGLMDYKRLSALEERARGRVRAAESRHGANSPQATVARIRRANLDEAKNSPAVRARIKADAAAKLAAMRAEGREPTGEQKPLTVRGLVHDIKELKQANRAKVEGRPPPKPSLKAPGRGTPDRLDVAKRHLSIRSRGPAGHAEMVHKRLVEMTAGRPEIPVEQLKERSRLPKPHFNRALDDLMKQGAIEVRRTAGKITHVRRKR